MPGLSSADLDTDGSSQHDGHFTDLNGRLTLFHFYRHGVTHRSTPPMKATDFLFTDAAMVLEDLHKDVPHRIGYLMSIVITSYGKEKSDIARKFGRVIEMYVYLGIWSLASDLARADRIGSVGSAVSHLPVWVATKQDF